MITLRPDGTAHAVRVGVALVDGNVWSSGIPSRLRTRQLRRDPRCTLFVLEPGFNYLTLEGTVIIHEGPEAPEMSLRLFQVMQAGMQPAPASGNLMWYGKELTREQFVQAMMEEQRLIYELQVERLRFERALKAG
jgi:Pyridoxamine 5'-phosphate oxidase